MVLMDSSSVAHDVGEREVKISELHLEILPAKYSGDVLFNMGITQGFRRTKARLK